MDPFTTLPELLSQTEKLSRQLAEHLHYDFLPKVQRMTTDAQSNAAALRAAPVPHIDPELAKFLSHDIVHAAHDLQRNLESVVVPQLHALRRLVIQGSANDGTIRKRHAEFRTACTHNSELRKKLRHLMLRLLAVDELQHGG